MRKLKSLLGWPCIVFLVLCQSCSPKENGSTPDKVQSYGGKMVLESLSEESLGRVLRVGMSKIAVKELLGEPFSEMKIDNGGVCFDYFYTHAIESQSSPAAIAGVSVFFQANGVSRWAPILRAGSVHTERKNVPADAKPVKDRGVAGFCSLWVLADDPADGWRYIDTAEFPKLGYISSRANLEFKQIKSLEEVTFRNPEKGNVPGYELLVGLTDEDAIKLKEFTAANPRRRILVMVGDRPIFAPYIVAPVTTGLLRIPYDDLSALKRSKDLLVSLLPTK